LRAVVPVPLEPPAGERAPRPVYVATWRAWFGLWIGLGVVLAFASRTRPVTAPG
jgi:hypothetical protein